MEIKIGDFILCVSNKYVDDFLTIGKLYEVTKLTGMPDSQHVFVIDDVLSDNWHRMDCFRGVE